MSAEPATDPTRQLLLDAATVHAVRREVRPRVTELVARLQADPLGDDEVGEELQEVLAAERTQKARRARERLITDLSEVSAG
jgi:hypothetical protein